MSNSGTILIVDDEQPIADFLAEFLSDEGYTAASAYNGLQALEMVEQHVPDLIILDVMMPHMNGEAVLQRLRAARSITVPIIMMSAGVDLHAFLAQGATATITKPIQLDRLLALVSSTIAPA